MSAEELNGLSVVRIGNSIKIDEDLVTDYIMIAGYTTTEAYEAAEQVAKYEAGLI